MARRLFTVENTFVISGRGLVTLPGIVPEGDELFRVGDTLRLRRPDGSEILAKIDGLELMIPNPDHEVVVLFNHLTKENVPAGTEIPPIDH